MGVTVEATRHVTPSPLSGFPTHGWVREWSGRLRKRDVEREAGVAQGRVPAFWVLTDSPDLFREAAQCAR